MPAPLFALSALLTGCWNLPEDDVLAQVPFSNGVVQTTTGVVDTIETGLTCPDGRDARFYVVHDTAWTEPAPVAIVLHSAAFDFVVNPDPADPLANAGSDSRMTWEWGVKKVWETLGMYPRVDDAEQNRGALPAALLDAGVVGVYPTDCWGDLWHNERGVRENDLQGDGGIYRNGGAMASWMVRIFRETGFAESQRITISPLIDRDRLYILGLGSGARGAISLMSRDDMAAVSGVLLDSPIDDVDAWAEDPNYSEGLRRIYFDPAYDPTQGEPQDFRFFELRYMLNRFVAEGEYPAIGGTPRWAVVYSDLDPQVPSDNLDATWNQLDPADDGNCVIETGRASHVFTNADRLLADEVLDFLLDGVKGPSCVESAAALP